VLHKAQQRSAGGVVDHPDQLQLRPSPFQPIVRGAVPLHQLPKAAAPRPPQVRRFHLVPPRAPQPRLRHQLAQRLAANPNPVLLPEPLAGQRRPVARIHRLGENLHNLVPHFRLGSSVRWLASRPVHHHTVALPLHALQQLAHPALAHSHPLGRFLLLDLLPFGLLEPIQPISFLEGVNRNFLNGTNRNFSHGADTIEKHS